MIHAAPDRPGLAVRRAVRTAGTTAALATLLSLTERWGAAPAASGTPGSPSSGLPYHLGVLVVLVALAPTVVLLPVAVRLLAHPRGGPLPDSAAASAVTGVVFSLGWLAGGFGLLLAHWLVSGGPAPDRSVTTRLTLTGVAASVAAGGVLTVRRVRAIRGGPAAPGAGPVRPCRPDLVDDLATLTARAFPGSGVARAIAALNRRVDDWAFTSRPGLPDEPGTATRGRLAGALAAWLVRFRPQPD